MHTRTCAHTHTLTQVGRNPREMIFRYLSHYDRSGTPFVQKPTARSDIDLQRCENELVTTEEQNDRQASPKGLAEWQVQIFPAARECFIFQRYSQGLSLNSGEPSDSDEVRRVIPAGRGGACL